MAIINSVLGPIDAKNLGFTLMHEHVMSQGFVAHDYPEAYGKNEGSVLESPFLTGSPQLPIKGIERNSLLEDGGNRAPRTKEILGLYNFVTERYNSAQRTGAGLDCLPKSACIMSSKVALLCASL